MIVTCTTCDGLGHLDGRVCGFCDGLSVVENGEYLTTSERRLPDDFPSDGEWDPEPTQELPRLPNDGRAA